MIIFQQDQNYIKEHANYETGVCYESQLNFYIKHDTTLLNIVSTLDLYNTSETRSNQKSFGLNYQKTGKELMSQDEITVMDGGKCIYQLIGFCVIIVIEANSYVNIWSSRLLPKFKTRKKIIGMLLRVMII